MKKNILRLGYCLLLFTLTSCFEKNKIDPNKLPPATKIGAETFGCKINGKVWRNISSGGFFKPPSTWMDIYNLNGFFFIFFGASNHSSTEARAMIIRFASEKLSVGEYFGKNMSDSMRVALRRLRSIYGIGIGNDSINSTAVDAYI